MQNVLKRTTPVVRDAVASRDFYRDVLGVRVWHDDEIVLSGRGLPAGQAASRTRPVRMSSLMFGDPDGGFFGVSERQPAA